MFLFLLSVRIFRILNGRIKKRVMLWGKIKSLFLLRNSPKKEIIIWKEDKRQRVQ